MPWKTKTKIEQRMELVREMKRGGVSVSELCLRSKISRVTAYKWFKRYRPGRLKSLEDKSRRPHDVPERTEQLWLDRVRRLRRKHPYWGARKLHHKLRTQCKEKKPPSVATISRWLKRWGMTSGRRRVKAGPTVIRSGLRPSRHCNDVWTVDFKGWYRIGNGTRVDPLTVRDLYSRYGLRIALLRKQTVDETRREFVKIFNKYGLPKRIRSDNGTPFGGGGPTGLTRLSAWWVKLGIKVEFIRPGSPYENGAHEQFHRIYKAEAAKKPTFTRSGQQKRSNRWLRYYNEERPHEGLQMKVPAVLYRSSLKRLPKAIKRWKYPAGWKCRWVKGNGEISWRGSRRFIGEAFVKDWVGLKPVRRNIWRVYFGPILIGELHENEKGVVRPAKYHRRR